MSNQITLRPYQSTTVKKVIDGINREIKEQIIVLPTGGGKSIVLAQLAKELSLLGHTPAVVVRKSILIDQLKKTLEKDFDLKVSVIKDGYRYEIGGDVTLIMEQTFYARFQKENFDKCSVIIKDEYHEGTNGVQSASVIDYNNPDYIIGLTATPLTEKGFLLSNEAELIEELKISQGIEQGYLTPFKYDVPSIKILDKLMDIKIQNGDYSTKDLDVILNTDEHNEFVADSMLKHKGRKFLVFANSIAHVEALSEMIKSKGFLVGYIHSKRTKEQNNDTLLKFKTKKIEVIVNMSILTTGFDEKGVDCVVLVRPTKVLRLFLQMCGRATRLDTLKKDGLILDLSTCLSMHGFPDADRSWLIRTEEDREKEYNKQRLDELGELIKQGKQVTKEKVLEYRMFTKTKRIDELTTNIQLAKIENSTLKKQNSDLSTKNDELLNEIERLKKILGYRQQSKDTRDDDRLYYWTSIHGVLHENNVNEDEVEDVKNMHKDYTDTKGEVFSKSCLTRVNNLVKQGLSGDELALKLVSFMDWLFKK